MEKYFVPFEIAKALKEIGFDEPCLYFITEKGKLNRPISSDTFINSKGKRVTAPLYDQVIEWFIEKHHLNIVSPRYSREDSWLWRVELMDNKNDGNPNTVKSYSSFSTIRKEGLNGAILKAIELVKEKKS